MVYFICQNCSQFKVQWLVDSDFKKNPSLSVNQFQYGLCHSILQEDYRKITVERKGETNFFTSQVKL